MAVDASDSVHVVEESLVMRAPNWSLSPNWSDGWKMSIVEDEETSEMGGGAIQPYFTRVLAEETGMSLEKITLADLGQAKRIEIGKENTTIIDGAGKESQPLGEIAPQTTKTVLLPGKLDRRLGLPARGQLEHLHLGVLRAGRLALDHLEQGRATARGLGQRPQELEPLVAARAGRGAGLDRAGVGSAEAALLHDRDGHGARGQHVGDDRARHHAEQARGEDADLCRAAAEGPAQRKGDVDEEFSGA